MTLASSLRLASLAVATLAAGCFSPTEPDCAFQCGDFNGFQCPSDYQCNGGDTAACSATHLCYCKRNGFGGACPFPQPDFAAPPDTAAARDLTAGPDQSTPDAAGQEMSVPDGAAPEMSVPVPDAGVDQAPAADLFGRPDLSPTDGSSEG